MISFGISRRLVGAGRFERPTPSAQGTGLGRQLMRAAEGRAREWGCAFMDLRVVNLRAELPPFYSHMGYAPNGTSEFPADVPTLQPCHFIHMSRPLV
jgi:GNAT superfamily N-acetyltransferase